MKTQKRKFKYVAMMMALMITACFLTACDSEGQMSTNSYDLKVVEATNEFYVNDFANILSEDQEQQMMDAAVELNDEYDGIQVVVTTVESLEDTVVEHPSSVNLENLDIEQISYAMFSQYGIGKDDMGILILFSSGDREIRIETGNKMQTYITDSKSGDLIDEYAMDYFIDDDFAEGLVSLQDAVIREIEERVINDLY